MEHHADHIAQAVAKTTDDLQAARADMAFAMAQGDSLREDEAYALVLDLQGQLSHLLGA